MEKQILSTVKELRILMQNSNDCNFDTLSRICDVISESSETFISVVDEEGVYTIVRHYGGSEDSFDIKKGDTIDPAQNAYFKSLYEIKGNEVIPKLNLDAKFRKGLNVVLIPIFSRGTRLATVLCYAYKPFTDLENVLFELFGTIAAIFFINITESEKNYESGKHAAVKAAIATLSYSELEAIVHIFKELGGKEGLLIASKVADAVGITRSVIVNALRKFESAGIIESRSLGMKGTYIKVINEYLMSELARMPN